MLSGVSEPRRMTISQKYKESGVVYIRYDGTIEEREHGQKNIAGNRPAFSKMQNQVEYNSRISCIVYGWDALPSPISILLIRR